jgi:hypothetical protein
MFTHLLNLLNLGRNLYQKLLMSSVMVDVIGKFYKNTYKIHMNEGQCKDFMNMFIRQKFLKNIQKLHFKRLLTIRSKANFDLSNVHNYHLVKVLRKKISHLILLFYFSRHT